MCRGGRSRTIRCCFDAAETSIEATAFAVQALSRRDPQNPVIERAVRWMMLNRTADYWSSTKRKQAWRSTDCSGSCRPAAKRRSCSVDVFVNGATSGRQPFTAAADDRIAIRR